MQKLIKKYVILNFWIFFVEASVTTVFAVLYFLMDKKPIYLYLSFGALALSMVINVFFIWLTMHRIASSRLKSDVTAADIVGDDIQDVYDFAQVGLVLVNEMDEVIWVNEWFEDEQTKLIDKNIFEWKSELRKLKESARENKIQDVKIENNNRVYDVKFLREANLYVFKDITEFNAMSEYSKANAPAIGIISIDNYQDIMSLVDEVKTNDMLGKVQADIVNYAKKYELLVRKFRADSYLIITNYEKYEQLMNDNFSIIDQVRNDTHDEDYELTLSIGFAVGLDDYTKLNELATSALDVALSRGGDQAVIQPYGSNLIFIGGKSETKGKRSRVKVRIVSKSLETLIKDASKVANVYIMGHVMADLDAIGSAVGLYYFAKQFGAKVQIVYDDKLTEAKTRKAFKQMFTKEELAEMTISPSQAVEGCHVQTLLILTDVHRPSQTMWPKLVETARKIAIVDHHRRGEEFVEHPAFNYVEPSASSASELVAEIISNNEKRIILPANYATMMLSGILLDTNYYRVRTGSRTYDASLVLKDFGADNSVADSFLKEEFEEYSLKVKIMATATTPFTGVVVCTSSEEDIIDRTMLSIVGQESLSVNGVNACFVIGRIGKDQVGISARSDGSINVQYLVEKLGGGGHFSAAAAQFNNLKIEEVKKKLIETLEYYLNDARAS
jgi:c-di-AMP phosphodiesterase-like protein